MEDFMFLSPTKLILKRDAEQLVGQEVKNLSGKALLVHYGDAFIKDSGIYERIVKSLKDAGVQYWELTGIKPNPNLEPVYKGIKICKENDIGCVLAVGGGSVIDSAKAIALGALYDGDVWDFYTNKAQGDTALPVGVFATIPATGSESSNGSVISNDDTGEKLDVMGDFLRPRFAVFNPEITFGLPKIQTAYGIADMFSHVTERYFSSSKNNEVTDRLAEGLMMAIIENSKKVMDNPKDYDARADLMVAATLSHNGLMGIGRNQDWATHMIGAPLSAVYGTVHGATISVLLPVWAEYVCDENLERFAQFANRVFGVPIDFYNMKRTAHEGIKCLRQWFENMGLPKTMSDIKINDSSKFAEMAEKACFGGKIGCMKQLGASDIEKIYEAAL